MTNENITPTTTTETITTNDNGTPNTTTETKEEFEQRIVTSMQERDKERAEQNAQNRAKFLKELRSKGVKSVSCEYEGYGDSGDVGTMTFKPKNKKVANKDAFADFIFAFAYQQFPGFEINEGGQGTLFWNIEKDTISLDHGQNITEIEETTLTDL